VVQYIQCGVSHDDAVMGADHTSYLKNYKEEASGECTNSILALREVLPEQAGKYH
jgi:hypothetical protein